MDFINYLENNIVILDGGMGTMLQQMGLKTGENTALLNLSAPDTIKAIHKAYFDAGSNVVSTNTFGANSLYFNDTELESIIAAAVENAKKARNESKSDKKKFIALDVGPTGKMLKPYGDLEFEDAVNIFKKSISLGAKYGVDLIFIETINDIYEAKSALVAAKETTDLPVMISCAFDENGKMMTGATPEILCALAESLGAAAVGLNCSCGPDKLSSVAERLLNAASIPVLFKPNAGLPDTNSGYNVSSEDFSNITLEVIKKGARLVGGCCGTTPDFIEVITKKATNEKPKAIKQNNNTIACSYTKLIDFENSPVIIGERINPTGKKSLKEALTQNNVNYILNEAITQEDVGADCLDVNTGVPGINESAVLPEIISEIQKISDLPLQIDTTDVRALENALRIYNGKPVINSVNGTFESMNSVFPLVKKYGGVVVALTLDENGIPDSAEGRIEIANKIINTAAVFGINKKDIIFDTLTTSVATDINAAKTTLDAMSLVSELTGCKTVLGVSNISFGLPARQKMNSAFLNMALTKGLSAAIVNPCSSEISECISTYKALTGKDRDFIKYTEKMQNAANSDETSYKQTDLKQCIIKGMSDEAANQTAILLNNNNPDEIINNYIIPALNEIGEKYESGIIFLPGLLSASNAAKKAFDEINIRRSNSASSDGVKFVIATVKGDVHDIGKNIVKMLLENYGVNVIDLGKDVDENTVLKNVIEYNASYLGLSALMTTTLPSMEKTVKLIRKNKPDCKIIIGGAVVTQEYADMIGAHYYASDAMKTVNIVCNK